MSDSIVTVNEGSLKNDLKELVRKTVQDTMLDCKRSLDTAKANWTQAIFLSFPRK